jgi:oxygen-dependent protoporphyrinogen oxidase
MGIHTGTAEFRDGDYFGGTLNRVARIEAAAARHPGLFQTGNAYHGVALGDCAEQGELIAAKVAAFLGAH